MINRNAFIPIKDAISRYMRELRVATCMDDLFIRTVQEKNFSVV